MSKKITMRDLAQACGVSSALISKALKGKEGVGKETRDFIMAKAQELGYNFDKLKRSEIQRVSVYVLENHDLRYTVPIFSSMVIGIDEVCKKNKINLAFSSLVAGEDIASVIAKSHCQAAIFISYFPDDMQEQIKRLNCPCVLISGQLDNMLCFNCNNYELSYKLTTHLIEQGAKRPVYFLPQKGHYSINERVRGFMQALYDHNIPFNSEYSLSTNPIGEHSAILEKSIKYLFSLKQKPDAILAYNDLIAMKLLKIFGEMGIRVPEDVLLTGFDNIEFSAVVAPPLTTANSNAEQLGREAMQALLDDVPPSNYIVRGDIVIRKSSLNPELNKEATKSKAPAVKTKQATAKKAPSKKAQSKASLAKDAMDAKVANDAVINTVPVKEIEPNAQVAQAAEETKAAVPKTAAKASATKRTATKSAAKKRTYVKATLISTAKKTAATEETKATKPTKAVKAKIAAKASPSTASKAVKTAKATPAKVATDAKTSAPAVKSPSKSITTAAVSSPVKAAKSTAKTQARAAKSAAKRAPKKASKGAAKDA